MKRYKAILFDLDGTLLPMDNDQFTKGYFKYLCEKLAPFGIPADQIVSSVWAGTKAMVLNDGKKTNREVFWDRFYQLTGLSAESGIEAACDEFYSNEFHQARKYTQENPLAVRAVELARRISPMVALATNPLFPMVGQKTRMEWVGLKEADFDLITSYESDCYCKPNPAYFTSLCERLKVEPSECLMIGNDENEDIYAAGLAGITDRYLVTDCLIAGEKHPWSGDRGTFADLIAALRTPGGTGSSF